MAQRMDEIAAIAEPAGQQPESSARLRRAVRTLPEQIADDLGDAIARGELRDSDRLLEQDISAQYNVSRGPVREALRLLAQRGLVDFQPRRGAFVIGVRLDNIADLFNVRAHLMGLAAQYFAFMADDDAHTELKACIAELERAGADKTTNGASYPRFTRRVSEVLAGRCGNEMLSRVIEHQLKNSAWLALWRGGRLDFVTLARRKSSAAAYVELGCAIEARNGAKAQALMQEIVFVARDNVMASLVAERGDDFDRRRLLPR